MNGSTQKIVKVALAADDTVTPDQANAALAVLNGHVPRQGPLPLLLTQQQVAEMLSLSRHTVRRMTVEGELHLVQVHKTFRYRRSEVEEIASRYTHASPHSRRAKQ